MVSDDVGQQGTNKRLCREIVQKAKELGLTWYNIQSGIRITDTVAMILLNT